MSMPSEKDLPKLRRSGITLLVSVVSTALPAAELEKARLRYLHLPVKYLRAPAPEQIEQFVEAARQEIGAGGKVGVHCVGGIGRTGTVIACYLVETGMTPHQAMEFVRRKRPGSIESLEQENAVFLWAARQKVRQAVEGLPADQEELAAILDEVEEPLAALATPLASVETSGGERETYHSDDVGVYVMPLAEDRSATRLGGRVAQMTRTAQTGYLKWQPDGWGVEIRSVFGDDGSAPKIEQLKGALRNLETSGPIRVTLTETLGQKGEAWIGVQCSSSEQGALLITTGNIVDMLVSSGVYDEVLLSSE